MLDFPQEGIGEFRSRFSLLFMIVLLFFFIVILRLGYFQILRGDFFWILSSEHTIKEIRIPATRGIFFDRKRRFLIDNRPSFDLVVIRQYLKNLSRVQETLKGLAHLSSDLFQEKWETALNLPPFYPLRLRTDIPYETAALLRANKVTALGEGDPHDLRGIEVRSRPLRRYPLGGIGAITLGYLGEISSLELERYEKEVPGRYFLGDLVGRSGLEKYWEKELKGRDGIEQRLVNAAGHEIASEEASDLLQNVPPQHGSNLLLTLDRDLQLFSEQQFQEKGGALVLLHVKTGEILAFVSQPVFDPSTLTVNVSPEFWQSLVSDPKKLFLNRAVQPYPPGSTYKIVTAIAALEEKVVTPSETIECTGGFFFKGRLFQCWREKGHGQVDLHRALVESCDTYFYKVGLRLGVDRLADYAKKLGLSRVTGIDLEDEKGGLIPTSEWKKKVFGTEWFAGETLSVAVGQGAVLVTPLQNALVAAEVANGGIRVVPHLVKTILKRTPEGEVEFPKAPSPDHFEKIPVSESTLKHVQAALAEVVQHPAGTAHASRSLSVSFGGKTGTAQVISEEGRQRAGGGEKFQDHAWFIGYAPVESPEIAVAVLVEHGGFGASAAAPIAKKVIEKYFEAKNEFAKKD